MPALLLRTAILTVIVTFAPVTCAPAAGALAQDWPQFLGPARNGV